MRLPGCFTWVVSIVALSRLCKTWIAPSTTLSVHNPTLNVAKSATDPDFYPLRLNGSTARLMRFEALGPVERSFWLLQPISADKPLHSTLLLETTTTSTTTSTIRPANPLQARLLPHYDPVVPVTQFWQTPLLPRLRNANNGQTGTNFLTNVMGPQNRQYGVSYVHQGFPIGTAPHAGLPENPWLRPEALGSFMVTQWPPSQMRRAVDVARTSPISTPALQVVPNPFNLPPSRLAGGTDMRSWDERTPRFATSGRQFGYLGDNPEQGFFFALMNVRGNRAVLMVVTWGEAPGVRHFEIPPPPDSLGWFNGPTLHYSAPGHAHQAVVALVAITPPGIVVVTYGLLNDGIVEIESLPIVSQDWHRGAVMRPSATRGMVGNTLGGAPYAGLAIATDEVMGSANPNQHVYTTAPGEFITVNIDPLTGRVLGNQRGRIPPNNFHPLAAAPLSTGNLMVLRQTIDEIQNVLVGLAFVPGGTEEGIYEVNTDTPPPLYVLPFQWVSRIPLLRDDLTQQIHVPFILPTQGSPNSQFSVAAHELAGDARETLITMTGLMDIHPSALGGTGPGLYQYNLAVRLLSAGGVFGISVAPRSSRGRTINVDRSRLGEGTMLGWNPEELAPGQRAWFPGDHPVGGPGATPNERVHFMPHFVELPLQAGLGGPNARPQMAYFRIVRLPVFGDPFVEVPPQDLQVTMLSPTCSSAGIGNGRHQPGPPGPDGDAGGGFSSLGGGRSVGVAYRSAQLN